MRRLVILISALMVLDTISFAAVIPLLPHYQEELGLSPFGAGVLLAAYSAAVLLFAVPSGRLSDVVGPKRMTAAGAAVPGGRPRADGDSAFIRAAAGREDSAGRS